MGKGANDAEALADLERVAAQYRALASLVADLRTRRDFLVVACWRRGISLRRIADAADVHYTRIQQLTRAAAATTKATGITHRPRKGKGT